MLEHAVQVAAPTMLYVPTAHDRPAAVMVEPAVTVCDGVTVYVPAPPLVPEINAVMVVPAAKPTPESVAPTVSAPDATAVMVSIVPAMPPIAAAEPEPAGQNEPAVHAAPAGDAAPAAQVVPALHGFDVDVVLPVAVQ